MSVKTTKQKQGQLTKSFTKKSKKQDYFPDFIFIKCYLKP